MKDKVVVITGAKGGLGTFVTNKFLAASAKVIGISRSIKSSDFSSGNFAAISSDITNSAAASEVAQQVLKRFGRIDVLAHIAGGFAFSLVHDIDDATWNNSRDTNLTSALNMFRAVLPAMRQANFGRIVAVGSTGMLTPHAGFGAYTPFKAALGALVQTVALENADYGITANMVLPDTMDTPANRAAMPDVDPKTWVQPADVAQAIFDLANDRTGRTNGSFIPIYPRKS